MAQTSADTLSVNALRFYFNKVGALVGTFEAFVAYYRSKGNFMTQFGESVRATPIDRVKTAMENLARRISGVPDPSDFFDALAKEVGTLTFNQVAAAAGDGVLAAGNSLFDFGKSSLLLYVAIAAIGVFVLPKLLAKGAFGK
jgi:hypothetical protein